MTCSVLIVDDSHLVREVLGSLIDSEDRLGLAGLARDGVEALRIVSETKVDVVICDIEMPQMSGLRLIPWIHRLQPGVIIVTYSSYPLAPSTARTLRIAHSFDKADDPTELIQIVISLCAEPPTPPDPDKPTPSPKESAS